MEMRSGRLKVRDHAQNLAAAQKIHEDALSERQEAIFKSTSVGRPAHVPELSPRVRERIRFRVQMDKAKEQIMESNPGLLMGRVAVVSNLVPKRKSQKPKGPVRKGIKTEPAN